MRISWITAAAILVSTHATAGLEQDLLTCSAKADKLDRLLCYDQLSASVTDTPKATSNTLTSTASTAENQSRSALPITHPASVEDEFGNANLKKDKEKNETTKIYMKVVSISKDAYGALKISFSNGQVWKQSDSRRYKVKEGQNVFIEKAALGSFILGTDERNSTIRVKRLK